MLQVVVKQGNEEQTIDFDSDNETDALLIELAKNNPMGFVKCVAQRLAEVGGKGKFDIVVTDTVLGNLVIATISIATQRLYGNPLLN